MDKEELRKEAAKWAKEIVRSIRRSAEQLDSDQLGDAEQIIDVIETNLPAFHKVMEVVNL